MNVNFKIRRESASHVLDEALGGVVDSFVPVIIQIGDFFNGVLRISGIGEGIVVINLPRSTINKHSLVLF